MKKLFESQDAAELAAVRAVLEEAGIGHTVRDENVSQTIPTAPFMPEVWVLDDADFERAAGLLQAWRNPPASPGPAWTCPNCGEQVDPELNACWNCGTSRPT